MEPILSPVQEVAELASIAEQDSSWQELADAESSHAQNDRAETVLRARAPNAQQGSTEQRRQTDLPWRRSYPPNELLRIGATVRTQVVRKSRSAQEDLSHLNTTGPRALRRSASAYNDILQGTTNQRRESLTRRSSTQSEGLQAPIRQPANPGDVEWQRARGFARFIKDHASPRHHRVTAGGRIVPAIPNTPPPTFHDAFLDAFLQTGSSEQDQLVFEPPLMHSNSIAGLGEPLVPVHAGAPANVTYSSLLRIPPGHEIIQVSSEGTIVITRRGTTIYQYELTDNGETNCKIIVREPKRSASQTALFASTPGTWLHSGDTTSNSNNEQLIPAIYGSDLLATDPTNFASSYQAPHETSHLPLQIRIENELQKIFLTSHQAAVYSCFNYYLPKFGQSTPNTLGGHIANLHQQLRSLSSSIESWTAILLDYERLLLVPSALGHAGIKSNQIKRHMILVKIDELMKRKLQIETHLDIVHADTLAQMESDEGLQTSPRAFTEAEYEGYGDRSISQHYDIGATPSESQVLSALAPTFIPSGQTTHVAQLGRVEAERQESDRPATDMASGNTEYWPSWTRR